MDRRALSPARVNRGSDRHRSGDLSIFSRTLYQLSYRALVEKSLSCERLFRYRDPDGT